MSITQSELYFVLGILELFILGHRPLPSRYNKIKHYISVPRWIQACNTLVYCDDTGNTGFHMGRCIYIVLFFVGPWALGVSGHICWKHEKYLLGQAVYKFKHLKSELHWCIIPEMTERVISSSWDFGNLFSGHIQVGNKTVLVAGTVHTKSSFTKL